MLFTLSLSPGITSAVRLVRNIKYQPNWKCDNNYHTIQLHTVHYIYGNFISRSGETYHGNTTTCVRVSVQVTARHNQCDNVKTQYSLQSCRQWSDSVFCTLHQSNFCSRFYHHLVFIFILNTFSL